MSDNTHKLQELSGDTPAVIELADKGFILLARSVCGSCLSYLALLFVVLVRFSSFRTRNRNFNLINNFLKIVVFLGSYMH